MPWEIDGESVDVTGWRFDNPQTLGLTIPFRAEHDIAEQIRAYGDRAGGYHEVVDADGIITLEPARADLAPVTVDPPDILQPALDEADYYVQSYNERRDDGGSQRFSANLQLIRTETRNADLEPTPTPTPTPPTEPGDETVYGEGIWGEGIYGETAAVDEDEDAEAAISDGGSASAPAPHAETAVGAEEEADMEADPETETETTPTAATTAAAQSTEEAALAYGRTIYGETVYGGSVPATIGEVDQWVFRFAAGRITVEKGRVSGGEKRARQATFTVYLDRRQMRVLLNSLGTTKAVSRYRVPDGDDYYVDNSSAYRNTVSVSPPRDRSADEYLLPDAYVVTGWDVGQSPDTRLWKATLSIVGSATPTAGQWSGSRYGYFSFGQANEGGTQ